MATMRDFLTKVKATKAAGQAPQAPEKPAEAPHEPNKPAGHKRTKQPKPAKRDAQPGDIITFRCGCRSAAGYLASFECRGCSNARRKEQKAANQDRLQQNPRLPDGSSFAASYDAATETWTGTLTCEGATFRATAGAVFKLLRTLDGQYRASLQRS
jgi:hypothetical protein